MPVTFDGGNKRIVLDSGTVQLDVRLDLYSAWKEWALTGDNAKFPPAFRVVGGDPIGGGVFVGGYFFLRNDLGWRIKPAEEDATVELVGNLYAEAPATAIFAATTGDYQVQLTRTVSPAAQGVSTSGGSGGDATAANQAAILAALATLRPLVELTKKIVANKAVVSPELDLVTIYNDDQTTVAIEFDLTDGGRSRTPAS